MCRGRSMNFSMYSSPLPKAFSASVDACWKSAGSSSLLRQMRIPRPPPPATALRITGYFTVCAQSSAAFSLSITPSEPGRIGTLAFFIVCRAVDFSPIMRVTSGGGPMNLMLLARQTSAKLAFSLSSP